MLMAIAGSLSLFLKSNLNPVPMAFRIPFFSKSSLRNEAASTLVDTLETPEVRPTPVNEEIFIDREAPDTQTAGTTTSDLERLTSEDLTERGYLDGYTHHDPEVRNGTLEVIKAQIRAAINQELTQVVGTMDDLAVHIEQLQDADMETTLRALIAKREQLQNHAMKLGEELLQATGGGGCSELACTTYTNGFNRGYKAYLASEFLTNTYTA